MESRTIFFNGPGGPRLVTSPVPSLESVLVLPTDLASDGKGHHRRSFFAWLGVLRARLARHGISDSQVRGYYASRFGRERMSFCTVLEWSVAAAELRAMCESESIFDNWLNDFRGAV